MKRDRIWVIAKLSTALLLLGALVFGLMLYIGSNYERGRWANTPLNIEKRRKLRQEREQTIQNSKDPESDGNVKKIPSPQ